MDPLQVSGTRGVKRRGRRGRGEGGMEGEAYNAVGCERGREKPNGSHGWEWDSRKEEWDEGSEGSC